MIYLYSGTPGSGKSLHTARTIYYCLKRGCPVIANFPINLDLIKKRKAEYVVKDNANLTPDFLIDYSRDFFKGKHMKEGQLLLVIDECQLMFNAREWNTKGRAEWLSFFTQHRHFGYDIILVAQFDRMIDRQIRSLIEYEYIHRKVSNFGAKGLVLSLISGGHLHVSVKMWYPLQEKVGSEFFKARKRYYRLYDTFALFDSDEAEGVGGLPDTAEPNRAEVSHDENTLALLDNSNT